MLLVGLTGGLGSGKTTAARMLADRGAVVVDADRLARDALEPGTTAFESVCELFGRDILDPAGRIDRQELAARVFADETKRRALESITHPEVFRLLAETVDAHRGTDHVIVFDAALIVETGFHEAVDILVVVSAPQEAQVRRAAESRGMDEDEARSRIAAQADPARREGVADIVIRNDGDLEDLEARVDELWRELRARSASEPGPRGR
jgi:dephospho-CoA kinase